MYTKYRSTKEIAAEIRSQLKSLPGKYSVTVDSNSIRIALMSWNENPFADGRESGSFSVNRHCIQEEKRLTDSAKSLFAKILEISLKEHYDNSESERDYFDTNFYLTISVGKFENPFIVK